jgi:hypothetical protein
MHGASLSMIEIEDEKGTVSLFADTAHLTHTMNGN